MDDIEYIHRELNELSLLEKQLLKKTAMTLKIQGLRRNSTLLMSVLCKYEQLIKNEIEYGKNDYDIQRSREHEKQRGFFLVLIKEYRGLKKEIYGILLKFKIK